MQKVFITRDHKATLVCPECDRARTVDLGAHVRRASEVKIRIKCPCGHRYPATLERRRFFRKLVRFRGTFAPQAGQGTVPGGGMAVLDLSRNGLRLRLNTRPQVRVGDRVVVEFHLDDRKRSLIRRESIVRRIDGLELGAEFASMDPSDPDTKAIGFYLFAPAASPPIPLAA